MMGPGTESEAATTAPSARSRAGAHGPGRAGGRRGAAPRPVHHHPPPLGQRAGGQLGDRAVGDAEGRRHGLQGPLVPLDDVDRAPRGEEPLLARPAVTVTFGAAAAVTTLGPLAVTALGPLPGGARDGRPLPRIHLRLEAQ